MKKLILALLLLAAPQFLHATLCSVRPPVSPCTPGPGLETDEEKKYIRRRIRLAQSVQADIVIAKAAYIEIRKSGATPQQKLDKYKAYYSLAKDQADLYKEVCLPLSVFIGFAPLVRA